MQLRAGIALAHAVQVEARIDRDLAGRDLADSATIEVGKGWRPGRFRWGRWWCRPGSPRPRLGFGRRRSTPHRWRGFNGIDMGGDPGFAPHFIDGARNLVPELGFVGRDGAAGPVRFAAAAAHCLVFCAAAFSGTPSVLAEASLGTRTKNRPGCLVTPATWPAASPEPK